MDRVGRWGITVGGVSVILVVLGIMVFIMREAYPLFLAPSIEQVGQLSAVQNRRVHLVGCDPYQEIAFVVTDRGVDFHRLDSGEWISQERPVELGEAGIASACIDARTGLLALGTDDGRVLRAQLDFVVTFVTGERIITPSLTSEGVVDLGEYRDAVDRVAYRKGGERRSSIAAITGSGRFVVATIAVRRGLLGGGTERIVRYDLTDEVAGTPTVVVTDGPGANVLLGTDRGEIYWYDSSASGTRPKRLQQFLAAEDGSAITALDFVLGDVSVLVGDAAGSVSAWFAARPSGPRSARAYRNVHQLQPHEASVTTVSPSGRDKQFLSADALGNVALHHMTSERTPFQLEVSREKVVAAAITPKADGMLVLDRTGHLYHYRLSNPHPEVTLGTLFGEVWYEGYDAPEYVWQSSGGTDEFEPKLSLVPLAFGTAKGTLYAMLFALPLAVLAAIYTSEFAGPHMRNAVKPTVELMASLPSVILGFLAGLWLAPLLETHVTGALLLFPVVPAVVIGASWAWSRLPGGVVNRLPGGEVLFLLIPTTVGAVWLAFALGPVVEGALFGGNFPQWLLGASGTRYDQRNSVVVGFAMGFAVVPIIYTICEDALSSVPAHLRAGSLALGATPWQTATRVVLPTASPGIFSAGMIGFGRAVGETMIVLMATGNTPITDWSIFNGMRTLAANIAVEIPEAPHEGTLYRVLFLSGLLLAAVTFLVNTVAEVIRQRLRKRYSRI